MFNFAQVLVESGTCDFPSLLLTRSYRTGSGWKRRGEAGGGGGGRRGLVRCAVGGGGGGGGKQKGRKGISVAEVSV